MFEYLRHCKAPKLMTKIQSEFDMTLGITQRPLRKRNLVELAKKFRFNNDWSAEVAGVSVNTFNRMELDSPLTVITNEIIVKLSELYQIGVTTFDGDRKSFLNWLDTHTVALNDYKPLQLIGTFTGISIVKDLLLRMEYSVSQ